MERVADEARKCRRLHFAMAAQCLVLQCQISREDGYFTRRMFVRGMADQEYRPLDLSPKDISQDSFAVAANLPVLAVNEFRLEPPSLSWSALRLVDVASAITSAVLTPELILAQTNGISAWIANVLEVSADGTRLICTRARELPRDDGGTYVTYELVEYDRDGREIRMITELKSIWF